MTIIIILTLIIYLITTLWVWHNLGDMNKSKKIIFIIVGLVINYIITLLIFNISKIEYQNQNMMLDIKNILVFVFTGLNSLITLPIIGKISNEMQIGNISKEQLTRKLIIVVIIFIICLFIESNYLKDIQQGIIDIYNLKINK